MCKDINSCGDVTFAQCVRYEEDLPEFSKITKDCVNIEDTNKDIYELIGEIKEGIPANLTTRLEELESQVSELQEQVTALQNQNVCLKDITECINVSTIEDPCGEEVTNLGQVLNYILSRLP